MQQQVPQAATDVAPALAVFNGRIFLTWKGHGGAVGIWWSSFDGTNWSPQQQHPQAGTSSDPALAVFNGRLYLAWSGPLDPFSPASGIWWSSFDGTNWSPQQQHPQAGASSAPALAVYTNQLYLAWKGELDAASIWWSSFDGTNWSPQQQHPEAGTSTGPALAAYDNNLYLAWKGQVDAVGIWWSSFDGTNWSPQQQHPEAGTNRVPAFAIFGGRLYLAWKGEYDATGIWASSFDGTNWSPQQQVPQAGTSDGPGVAAYNNNLYFAWKGERNAVGIWYSGFDTFPPTHLDFDTGLITFSGGTPVDGSAQLHIYQDGTCHFTGEFHTSGALPYDYGIAVVIKDGQAQSHGYTFAHKGTVSPVHASDPWDETAQNATVTQYWP